MIVTAVEQSDVETRYDAGAYRCLTTHLLLFFSCSVVLSEELHRSEVKSVISIDFSPVCIDICKKKYTAQQGMQCQAMHDMQRTHKIERIHPV